MPKVQESTFIDYLSQPATHVDVNYHHFIIEMEKKKTEKINDAP